MRNLLRSLLAGLMLAFAIRPPVAWRVRPAAHFWWLIIPAVAITVWRDWLISGKPAVFYVDGLQADALSILLLLAGAVLAAAWSQRRVVTFSLAVHASAAALWLSLASVCIILLRGTWPVLTKLDLQVFIVFVAWWLVIQRRIFDTLLGDWHWAQRSVMAVIATVILFAPNLAVDSARYWYQGFDPAAYAAAAGEKTTVDRSVRGSAEELIYAQRNMLDAQIEKLVPHRAGVVDAYFLSFGGDGGEDVFRNEIDYAEQLFAARFAGRGRTLSLLNHPLTTDQYPIASLSNFKRALQGIAAKMDVNEDLLFVFLTTHGSREHTLYVALEPLALDQISPEALRESLDAAGIQWRAVIVSACYSGGFIDALATPMSLILTAARADRTSFGCGAESDITYFGQAFLVEALNQTTAMIPAFELAREAIAKREIEGDIEPSDPQKSVGVLISSRLDAWQSTLEDGAAVPFEPAPPMRCDAVDVANCLNAVDTPDL